MSAWFDRLFKGIAPEYGRLHLAHDPDHLLLDEFTLSALAERVFFFTSSKKRRFAL